MTYFVANIEMETVECCECHILFAVPKEFKGVQLRLRENGRFYCPNGHSQCYIGKTETQKLKERLASEQQCCIQAREEANQLERTVRAYKGVTTKLKKKLKDRP